MAETTQAPAPTTVSSAPTQQPQQPKSLRQQRPCACGEPAGLDGQCANCRHKRLVGVRPPLVEQRPPLLQAQLRVGAANDRYEQEANRAARLVVNMPNPPIQRFLDTREERPEDGFVQPKPLSFTPLLQRQTAAPAIATPEQTKETKPEESNEGSEVCIDIPKKEEKEPEKETPPETTPPTPQVEREEQPVQTKRRTAQRLATAPEIGEALQAKGQAFGVSPEVETQINRVRRGGGRPLDPQTRAFMEPRFGYDFGSVRIHDDSQAAQSAAAINARAYTVGSDIVFGAGQYSPKTRGGQELLAHEMAHVAQQGAASQLQRQPTIKEEDEDEQRPTAKTTQQAADTQPTEQAPTAETATTESPASEQPTTATPTADTQPAEQAPMADATTTESPDTEQPAATKGPEVATAKQPAAQTDDEAQQMAAKAQPEQPAPAPAATPTAAPAPAATTAPSTAPPTPAPTTASESDAATGETLETDTAAEGETPADASATPEATEEAADKAPASPEEDSAFQAVIGQVGDVSATQKAHAPAKTKAREAQAAAQMPPQEIAGRAQNNQVGEMQAAETPGFDAAAFKQQLQERIKDAMPGNMEEAEDFKDNNKLDDVKENLSQTVEAEKEASQGPVEKKKDEPPDTSAVKQKPVKRIPAANAGPPPAEIAAENATPKPKGQSEIETPAQQEAQGIDQKMAEAQVTDEQLAKSNEPAFQAAAASKQEAHTNAVEAPKAYRQFEQNEATRAQTEAKTMATSKMGEMHKGRGDLLKQVVGKQTESKTEDEKERQKVGDDIQTIYDKTKENVDKILTSLDQTVADEFDRGAEIAQQNFENYVDAKMEAYKDERYSFSLEGAGNFIGDTFTGLPDEVNEFYVEGRVRYVAEMDGVIDKVVALIGNGLMEAKAEIARGKQEIQDYINNLPQHLQDVGNRAAKNIESKFAELAQSVDDKQNDLVETLANKYQEKLKVVDDRIAAMKEANKGLVDKALDAVGGVIKTILELKNMLLKVLASAADTIMTILENPIGFITNVIKAIGTGLNQFVANIGGHLQKGFVEWLTGTMGGAGIQMPENILSLEGVLDLVLQILGLTWENFRARAVNIFGETVVNALETGFEIFVILKDKGIMGLWEWIKEKLASLKDQVIEGIKEMLITEVIEAGVQWLLGMLGGPAGAFIKAAKMIYDIIMWFMNNAGRLLSLVQGVINSVKAIASGNLQMAAKYVEESLAKVIPIAIGFLASLVGLGDLSKKVRKVIDKIQAPVNKAIDSVLEMIQGFVQKIAKMLGFGGQGKDKGEIGKEVPFSAAGEGHKLYVQVQGSQATLMVASETMTVEQRLADWEKRTAELGEEQRGQAQSLIARAKPLLGEAEESADFLAAKKGGVKKTSDGDKIKQEQGELETEETTLADVLRQLFELFGDEAPQPNIQLAMPFTMAGAPHHVYVSTGQDTSELTVEMASQRRDKLAILVYRAEEKEKKGDNRGDVLDYLGKVSKELQELAELWRAKGYAITPTGQDGETYVRNRVEQVIYFLRKLGSDYKISDLENIGHLSDYAELDEIKPEYRGERFRRTFYAPSGWNANAEEFRDQQLKLLKQEAKQPQWQSDPLYGNPNAFVCRDRAGSWTPHLAIAIPGDNKSTPLDHIEPVSAHWNRIGHKQTQAQRETWYQDTSNLQVTDKFHNSQKGGVTIDYKVTKDFRGPKE